MSENNFERYARRSMFDTIDTCDTLNDQCLAELIAAAHTSPDDPHGRIALEGSIFNVLHSLRLGLGDDSDDTAL